MRRYLAEFLSDPRVVPLPPLLWQPVLQGIVLRRRPARAARKYAAIWLPEGSPLEVYTKKQAEALRRALPQARVEYAMRYGEPGIAAGLAKLAGCETIVLPLYPQYAESTTASVADCLPVGVPMLREFHVHPAYIAALGAVVRQHWQRHGQGRMLVMSFHGLPRRTGEAYRRDCLDTASLLARHLGLDKGEWRATFQSRFGFARWLEPYTEPTLRQLARMGIGRVDVCFPGFVADCLETLEEIGIAGRRAFLEAGGRELYLVPCLNDSPEWISALAAMARGTA